MVVTKRAPDDEAMLAAYRDGRLDLDDLESFGFPVVFCESCGEHHVPQDLTDVEYDRGPAAQFVDRQVGRPLRPRVVTQSWCGRCIEREYQAAGEKPEVDRWYDGEGDPGW